MTEWWQQTMSASCLRRATCANMVCLAHPWTMSSGRQCSPSWYTVLRLGPASVQRQIAKDLTRSYADTSDYATLMMTFRRWRKCSRILMTLCLAGLYETTSMGYSITCQNIAKDSITWDHGSIASNLLRTTELNNRDYIVWMLYKDAYWRITQ